MADFDLSLVVRGVDQGASATGAKLEKSIDGVAAAQTRAAGASDRLAGASGRGAGAADKGAVAAAREAAAASQAAAAKDRATVAALRLAAAQEKQALQTARTAAATYRLSGGLGTARSNMSGFGAQFADVTQTLALGINPFTVLLQQGNQLANSLQNTKGAFGRLAGYIAGPFGSILIGAVGIIGLLATSQKKAKEASVDLGDGIDFASKSARDLIASIEELNTAQEKSIRTTNESERAKYKDALAALDQAKANREVAKSILDQLVANRALSAGAGAPADLIAGEIGAQRAFVARLDAGIATADELKSNVELAIVRRRVGLATDEAGAATIKFERAERKLNERFKETKDLVAYTKALANLTRTRDAEIEAARKSGRKTKGSFDGKSLESFGSPVQGRPNITSGFGQRSRPIAGASTNHLGLDFGAKLGDAILATADGFVKRAGAAGGYGNQLQINHGGGTQTRYSHLSKFDVGEGDRVTKGQVIGRAGRTGTATGTHLHYEVLVNGKKVDPKGGRFPFDPAEVEDAGEKARDAAQRIAEQLASFGQNAADSITRISASFDEQPTLIDRAAKSVDDLNELIKELGERKPPNFKELIADAEKAKVVVAEGVNRPYLDFIESQQQALEIQQLITAGRQSEADALRIVLDFERTMKPLSPARKDAVLATVEALKAEQRETEILRDKQQKYLSALGEIKGAVRDVLKDPLEGLKDLPGRLIGAFANLKTDELFEKLFGDTFRQIEDQITGANVAKDAAANMAAAVDRAATSIVKLGNAAEQAASGVSGTPGQPPVATGDPSEIVVTGRRQRAPESFFAGTIEKLARGIGISKSQDRRNAEVGDALKRGVQIKDDTAAKLGKFAGKAAGGAATGAVVNSLLKPLGKALGFKTSAVGAQVGGAVGAFLPIPFGKEIGAVVGSILGGLFKKTKKGSASITNAFDGPSASGKFQGSNSKLAQSIQGSILQIAEQLGGGLGSFAVSIGKRGKDFVVDPSGRGKTKGGGTKKFKEEGEAVAFAILDAIRDGAITGLSDAVKKALSSSDDIERALREALKVQELEVLIGGLGSRLAHEFRRFDAQGAERVRLAKKYGLDVIAVEKINAEERLKLLESVIGSRIGALLDFKKSIAFGDLFEGDATTRRSAILGEIGKVQKQAEAGVDGAADKLADLYRTLINTSKEAFGTAGPELAADRALATSGVDRVIELENARIADARDYQDRTLAAANQNNVLTNETNDLLARLIAQGGQSAPAAMVAPGGFGGGGSVLRESNLSVRSL